MSPSARERKRISSRNYMRRKRATAQGRRQSAKWYADWIARPGNREKARNGGKARYRNNIQDHLYRAAKRRAKIFGWEFNILKSDISIPKLCPILKVSMVIGTKTAPSLDRKNSDKGYVPGNISVISKKVNRCKSNLTVAEVRRLLHYMEN